MVTCQNCGTELTAKFCPQCGQKNVLLERPISALLGEVLRETFDVDGRAARTVSTLFRRPGLLTEEFLAGRRRHFTPPFRLYLVISVLFFVVVGWVAAQGILTTEGVSDHNDVQEQVRFVANDLPKLMFVLLPVFALLLKLAYRDRLYFDHIIHSLHMHSAVYVGLALLLPLENLANASVLLMLVQILLFGWLIGYCTISIRRVYGASWAVTGAKTIGVLFTYLVLLTIALELATHVSLSTSIPFFTD